MDLILTVSSISAPVFLIAAVGVLWCRLGYDYPTEFITRLVMGFGVPCLIFTTLMRADITTAALSTLSFATVIAYGGVLAVSWIVVSILALDRRSFLAPLVFGNTGNLGLPLVFFAYGDLGLGYGIVVFALMAIMSFTIGIWMIAGQASPLSIVKEPIVGASLMGVLFLSQGWQTPVWLTNALDLIGQTAIPLMLMTLGVAVARLSPGRMGQALGLSVAKFIVSLGAGILTGLWFDLPPVAFGVLVVQLITPVAVTSYLLAERYRVDAGAVAGLVVVSTLLSVITLPLTLWFLLQMVV